MTQLTADAEPNSMLRATRESLRMSQEELARAVRSAGDQIGEPNACDKRTVQRWEAGAVTTPRGNYARALEYVTGMPVENLGFGGGEGAPGMSRRQVIGAVSVAAVIPVAEGKARGPLSGIWLSRYEYPSSSRSGTFTGAHYVLLIHRGNKVQARSIGSPSRLVMDFTMDGNVLTGTWREDTDPAGYYRGATYHGAIQLIAGPSGHRLKGRWTGFGKEGEVNSGPWTLDLVSADTSHETIRQYGQPPSDHDRRG